MIDNQPACTYKFIKSHISFCFSMSKSDFKQDFEGAKPVFNIYRPIRGQEKAEKDEKHNFNPKNHNITVITETPCSTIK